MSRGRIPLMLVALGALGACSGSMRGCSACGSPLAPIPGGFDSSAQIDRAAQVRVTHRGIQFVDDSFQAIASAYARLSCGTTGDVPCPSGFLSLPAGGADPSTCDTTRHVCVEQASGKPGPLVGFQIQRTTSSNATICRDDPSAANARPCYVWLRFEALNLSTQAPNQLSALVTTQIRTTDIPLYYSPLNMNCIVSVDSSSNPNHTQDFTLNAMLGKWASPSGTGGGQLQLSVQSVNAQIPDGAVHIAADPVDGGILDTVLCGIANLGPVKGALIPQLTNRLSSIASSTIDNDLGWKCTTTTSTDCPSMTSCNSKGLCADASGNVVPRKFGVEGRMDFSHLLGGLTGNRPGQGDISFVIGGSSSADMDGLTIGSLGGAEAVSQDARCAMILPSPRLRPSWMAPNPFPTTDKADLDFDGVPETPFMLALGLSDDLIAQAIWTVYTTGLFCQSIAASQVDLLNTGSLALLMPSLHQLTHDDRYPSAIFPARLTLQPGAEPVVTIGSGKVDTTGPKPRLVEPLIDLLLKDLVLNFYAQVEERWVRLMTVTADLHIGLGAIVNPQNQIEFVLGDLTNALSNVRVTNSDILAESPMDLASALPSLVQLALPRLTQRLMPVSLPSGMALGGFELNVLGIRGVPEGNGYRNVGVYADLMFDPTMAPNLSIQARTEARILAIRAPAARSFAVGAPGGPQIPEVEIALSGQAPRGEALEYQVRVDGSLWTPFFEGESGRAILQRPEFLVEGHHAIEVRARIRDQYRSLDPTPVVLDAVIDVEPPSLWARLDAAKGGIFVEAYDVVSHDALRFQVGVGAGWRDAVIDKEGFIAVPEVLDPNVPIAVAAVDEQGLRAERVLRSHQTLVEAGDDRSTIQGTGGCRCVRARGESVMLGAAGFIAWLTGVLLLSSRFRRGRERAP